MRELFKEQIEKNRIVDNETLSKCKFYANGTPIQLGDKILFAFIETYDSKKEMTLELIALTEEQFDFFICEKPDRDRFFPVLKYIGDRVAEQITTNLK